MYLWVPRFPGEGERQTVFAKFDVQFAHEKILSSGFMKVYLAQYNIYHHIVS